MVSTLGSGGPAPAGESAARPCLRRRGRGILGIAGPGGVVSRGCHRSECTPRPAAFAGMTDRRQTAVEGRSPPIEQSVISPAVCLVSVIVPARDAAGTLPRVLECLRAQETGFDFEVLVVDNGSRDATPALAQAAGAPVRLIGPGPRGPGPAAARNRGARQAGGSLLAFCDSDCYPTRAGLRPELGPSKARRSCRGWCCPSPGWRSGRSTAPSGSPARWASGRPPTCSSLASCSTAWGASRTA